MTKRNPFSVQGFHVGLEVWFHLLKGQQYAIQKKVAPGLKPFCE